jgi:hypothetical protein
MELRSCFVSGRNPRAVSSMLSRYRSALKGPQTVHISGLSPVANELYAFWEGGRMVVRFASDIDLADPAVWQQEDLSAEWWDIDEKVVVSLDEVAGSNAYVTRDMVGRVLFNCVVLGQRLTLDPEEIDAVEPANMP